MTRLGPTQILEVSEAGRGLDPLQRALALWRAANPDASIDPASLSIGRRDLDLFQCRIDTFGPRATGYVECPACDAPLEFSIDLHDLMLGNPAERSAPELSAPELSAPEPGATHTVVHGAWTVELRLPTTTDIDAVRVVPDARTALLRRCIVAVTHDGEPRPVEHAVDHLSEELDRAMHELDPQADIEIKLDCRDCEHSWVSRFDIAHYLWREIEVDASTLLAQVHVLAKAYGWTEAEVLALGPTRRRSYLDLVGGRP